jgi:hypothetical protein
VATPRDNRSLVGLLANDAGEGNVLQYYILLIIFFLSLASISAGNYCAADVLLSFGDVLPLSIKLPALFVVFPSMEVLAV